ncbi:hypothetical protein C1701_17645 [Actinoalloteichus sp. AHMU CJ021]|uniref:AtpZ/AtpI family protein n=1 Tax=Actinoalloteichus caeruleus DSM 43889 TaxID=1120930 RepID=A0ABT1JQP9_ACTCY|nr:MULTISPECIES: hypothetical protein [Actinoalloteichus]AUS81827.1 hypothetical protein C1701_17645 [Actinoalloteichus sp. AHMU CJ021]MCP2334016.1 hypothetical protein [Actinoalloteichus caeruleus DSM 43889]
MSDQSDKPPQKGESTRGLLIRTLIAGPIAWGGIGFAVDLISDSWLWTFVGLGLGLLTALYIVYVRFGRA